MSAVSGVVGRLMELRELPGVEVEGLVRGLKQLSEHPDTSPQRTSVNTVCISRHCHDDVL